MGLRNIFIVLFIFCRALISQPQTDKLHLKFDFGDGEAEPGYTRVLSDMNYSKERGFGFYSDSTITSLDRHLNDRLHSDFITGSHPFIFAADVPEGNYDVIVTLGDQDQGTVTTIKTESRRLMFKRIQTTPGEFKKVVFTTNVRYSQINDSESVKLKPREIGDFNWDRQLTIEFNNTRPCVCAVEIIKNTRAVTVYLAGNSTVTDQRYEPWASWGQMLPSFFQPRKIVVANHAESGEALKSFVWENRLKKILSTITQGDWLFIQFGHNDQKPQSSAYVKPFSGYKQYLKLFIDRARQRGAIPVLVTPVQRRRFDEKGRIVNTHGDYPEAMRQVAREENVPLIDLFKMSGILFEALGVEGTKHAFVHYPAGTFPGQDKELKDDTHFNNYGAYQLAQCIVKGIKENKLGIAKFLLDDLPSFDPGHPDAFENWDLPVSPFILNKD